MDRESFDRLLLQHLSAAQRFAIRLTGDAHRSEDLLHDAIVRAVRGSSLLEVHAGSATGRPLFAGTLQRGDAPQIFDAKRIWLQASSPEALRVVLNGRTLILRKGKPLVAVVTKDGLRTTSR